MMDDNVGDSGQYGGLLRPLRCSCGKWTLPSGANRLQSIDNLTWHRRPPGQCEDPDDPSSPNPADEALWEAVASDEMANVGWNCDIWRQVDFGEGTVKVRCTISGPHDEHECHVWFTDIHGNVRPGVQKEPDPLLGLATNGQLLQELITRLEGVLLTDQSPGISTQRIKHVGWALRLAVMMGEMDTVTKEYRTVER